MLGSSPNDGDIPDGADIIEMSPDKPRRTIPIIGGRPRLVLVVGACLLLVAGAAIAAVRLTSPAPPTALEKLVTEVTTVPVSETVTSPTTTGSGGAAVPVSPSSLSVYSGTIEAASPITPVSSPPLTADGKPEVLSIEDEYCPFCVAGSWALIVALSRFGEFSALSTIRTPVFEGIPRIDGFTFYRSSYVSHYLTFVPVEITSNVLVSPHADPAAPTSYRKLQRLTPAEQAVFSRLDRMQYTPFLDFGGKAKQVGTNVSPFALANLSWTEIAADLRHPKSAAGQTILAAVKALTSQLCRLTGDRPATVCSH